MSEATVSGSLAGSTSPYPRFDLSLPPHLQCDSRLACLDEHDLFFPLDYGLRNKDQIEAAKALCLTCPVRDLCLAWAVPQATLDGVWGATTPPERRRMRTRKTPPSETKEAP